MITIIKDDKLWMEEAAIAQLKQFAQFPGVIDAAGLPDLHFGKVPVGTTFTTSDIIYPFFIGNDIGCGMCLAETGVKTKKLNLKQLLSKLEGTQMKGTYSIGGGNHFCELQSIDHIYHKEEAALLGLNKKLLYILTHTGSRNMGTEIHSQFGDVRGYPIDSKEAIQYLALHEDALAFARTNRIECSKAFLKLAGYPQDIRLILDCMHNGIEKHNGIYYHHKGSISAFTPYAVIAGSRGSYSYLVKCIPVKETLYSISHGAGRKWPRHLCKGRLEQKYKKDQLKTSALGSVVITNEKKLLYEEASEAYKNIEHVIHILEEAGCIEVIARFKPEVTYKC